MRKNCLPICCVLVLVALLGLGCFDYYAEVSVRELAAFNALPESVEHSPLPGDLVGDPLNNPSATILQNRATISLGGRLDDYSVGDGLIVATGSFVGLGAAGARLSLALGDDWSVTGGVRRLGSFEYTIGTSERSVELGGDLWSGGASLSWGQELRLGLGVEGLYGGWSYQTESPDDAHRHETATLTGLRWRAALGWSSSDWAVGAMVASEAALGRGPGLPGKGRVWFFLPLAAKNGDLLQLQLLGGISGWADSARLTGTEGQNLSSILQTTFLGRGGLRWLLHESIQIEIGAELTTYPLLEGNDHLLYPSYALAVGFGETWRWRGEAVYRHLGGQAGDLIDATTLDLRLKLETEL